MKKYVKAASMNDIQAEDIYAKIKSMYDFCNMAYDKFSDFSDYVANDKEYMAYQISLDLNDDVYQAIDSSSENVIEAKNKMGKLIDELGQVLQAIDKDK